MHQLVLELSYQVDRNWYSIFQSLLNSFYRIPSFSFFLQSCGGILLLQGQRVSFAMQVEQFVDTFQQMTLSIGEAASERLVSNSVFYISIGVNDYIHFYIRNISNVQNLYTPWSFNQFLASNMRQELKVRVLINLYMSAVGGESIRTNKYDSELV